MRDLSKPLASSVGPNRKKRVAKRTVRLANQNAAKKKTPAKKVNNTKPSKRRTVTKTTSASGVKTKDVVRVSKRGNKVTVRNKTKNPAVYGDYFPAKNTTKSKVKLSNSKGTDDYHLQKAKSSSRTVLTKGNGKKVRSTGRSKSNTNSGAGKVISNLPGGGMRNYKRPTKGKLKS